MKKITLLLLLCLSAHLSFSQILFEDNFDGSGPGIAGWTVTNVDGLTPNANVAEFTDAWIEVDRDGSAGGGANYGGPAGDFAVASTSWYTPAGTSDDWLITPQINLTADATLYWDAKAQDAGFPDGYEVRLSTSGTNTATDFTELLFSIAAEDPAFQSRQVDLSAYTGQNVYIAFRNNSTDQFVLLVDNVEVSVTPSCVVPTDFTAGTVTATSFEVTWMDANSGTPTWEIEWGADGFVQGTGTSVTGLTSPMYTFPGLTGDTAYDFYIRTNCGGAEGDSEWVGPIGFTTLFDCSNYGLPYSEDWSNANAYASCYTVEDANSDSLSWLYNTVNDLDGDGTDDIFVNVFPQAANVAKDDWLFTPVISGTENAEYSVTIVYNAVDFNATANESFDIVIADSPSSTATTQSIIGSYSNITQSGVFGDTGGNDLISQAYSSTAVYTAPADGDFYVGIHANTTAANSDIFLVLSIAISETLSVDEFDSNNFSYSYNKDTSYLTLESSNLPFDSIELYSILGQKVIGRQLSQNREAIDMSSLTEGVYLATVNINGSTKTFKVIKQ